MQLVYTKEATKALLQLPPKIADAIDKAMDAIAADPVGQHRNVTRLVGSRSGYRLRRGDWRVLYTVDVAAQTVFVDKIKPRGEAYKR